MKIEKITPPPTTPTTTIQIENQIDIFRSLFSLPFRFVFTAWCCANTNIYIYMWSLDCDWGCEIEMVNVNIRPVRVMLVFGFVFCCCCCWCCSHRRPNSPFAIQIFARHFTNRLFLRFFPHFDLVAFLTVFFLAFYSISHTLTIFLVVPTGTHENQRHRNASSHWVSRCVSISFAPLWLGFAFTNSDTICQWFLRWMLIHSPHLFLSLTLSHFPLTLSFFSPLINILLMPCNTYLLRWKC